LEEGPVREIRSPELLQGGKGAGPVSPYELLSSIAASLRTGRYASPVQVRGVYRKKPGRDYNGFWYDELQDERVPQCKLDVRIPGALRTSVQDGQVVSLLGVLVAESAGGRLRLVFNASRAEVEERVQDEALQERLSLLRRRTELGRRDVHGALRAKLLKGEQPFVVVVLGAASVVRGDIEAALGPAAGHYRVMWVETNTGSVQSLAGSLREAAAMGPDLLAVVRGGGSGLEVFSNVEVARAALEARCPVVSAVGHSADWSLLDEVSDWRLETPSRLGQWLREVAEQVSVERALSVAAAQREAEAIRKELEATRKELEAVRSEREAFRIRLRQALEEVDRKGRLLAKARTLLVGLAGLALFLAVLLVFGPKH
jgi:exodeoxyribonuclease VII large subunit